MGKYKIIDLWPFLCRKRKLYCGWIFLQLKDTSYNDSYLPPEEMFYEALS